MSEHPSLDITASYGSSLAGRTVALCITGSVAAVRAVELARLLMRHGAVVRSVMSGAACRIIHPELMHWATGNPVVCGLTGEVEHIQLAGNVAGKADVVLVAPATANTVGKIAHGIDDTPVTTVVTTAIGERIPIVVVPAMHEPMYRHPIVLANLEKLAQAGVTVLDPRVEEGKAKIAENELILATLRRIVNASALRGRRVLLTAGRTVEYVDPIRVITNNSSGKMGCALAAEAYAAGAEVTLIYGKGTVDPPAGVRVRRVETAEQMYTAVLAELADAGPYDAMIAAAAVSDWKTAEAAQKKITTHGAESLSLELVPTPKIIDTAKRRHPGVFLVAFRAQHDISPEAARADARDRMRKASADMIAVNDVARPGAGFESDTNELLLLYPDHSEERIALTTKTLAAQRIIEAMAQRLGDCGHHGRRKAAD